MPPQLIDFGAKGVHVLKAAVHRSEADVAHLVQVPQLLHDHFSDAARRDFALAQTAQFVADSSYGRFDRFPSKGSRLRSPLTTVGRSNSAVSNVVNRSVHARHSRRLRICRPSPARRESITLVSVWPQNGQCIGVAQGKAATRNTQAGSRP